MLHKTRGIVLRSVKYGETSAVVTIFTELFGVQSYLVNGIRSSKPGLSRGNILQAPNILDLVVYHQENKNLQRIAEFKLGFIYTTLHFDLVKNTVVFFLVELLQKSLRQPEHHPSLYLFTQNALQILDQPDFPPANFPLYFTLKLAGFLGFRLQGNFSPLTPYIDFQDGTFVHEPPSHTHYLDPPCSEITSHFLESPSWSQVAAILMNKDKRRTLLQGYLQFLRLHLPDFPELKSPAILQEILE
ncbi:MAG: DNA repair protein RecO [Chitinophagaceae bacterium]